MKQSLTVFSLVLFAMLCSCNKESAPDFIQTTGEITIEERTLENFNELEVFNTINVLIVPDTVNKVVIEAGENLIPDIVTTVKEGKLILKNTNKFNLQGIKYDQIFPHPSQASSPCVRFLSL